MLTRWSDAIRPAVFAYNGGIGDRLCNLPALRAIESLFPGRLELICGLGDRSMFYSELDLRAVREVQFTRVPGGWRFDSGALAERILDCDLLLCLNPWHGPDTSNLLQLLPDAASIGFFRGFRHQIACDYYGHAIDMAFAVPAYLDRALTPAQFAGPPAISRSAIARAREFRQRNVRSEFSLFVHTDTQPQKCWHPERFAQAINRFLRDHSNFTALVVDLHKRWIPDAEFPDRVVPFSLPLDVSLGLLRDSDLFLGVDSCHLHAADLSGVPGVALFGPTRCRRWGYRFTDHWHLQGAQRMDTIGVGDVCTALERLALSARSRNALATAGSRSKSGAASIKTG